MRDQRDVAIIASTIALAVVSFAIVVLAVILIVLSMREMIGWIS